ncbi:nucleoside phosphorylase domain-containing protein [Nemania sp. FL0031]|nr:nucleoside phosphorylase domain-containing protein [Nemania sp. FL0031]
MQSSSSLEASDPRDIYTIGLICELFEAQTAAIMMLDEEHDYIPKDSDDPNAYTLGSIAGHNVVIACMPKRLQGPKTLAFTALWMTSTFPRIRLSLLVGIGSGIPSRVRLGDVVVGMPDDMYPGVVEWQLPGERGFGELDKMVDPQSILLSALTKLRSTHEIDGSKVPEYLSRFREHERLARKYPVSGKLQDPFDDNADNKTREAEIHYGLIAFTTYQMPDNALRDSLDSKLCDHRLLCIHTNAPELITRFPCLVISGIYNYADETHNSCEEWQGPAAAVAAAFAREVVVSLSEPEVAIFSTIFNLGASAF